jgi:hypothetical protein
MIITFEKFKFYKTGKNVMYSAIVLDEKSRQELLQRFVYGDDEFNDWIKICHHMTICMGELPEHIKRYWLDEEVELVITHIGRSDKALAVKVEGFFTLNKKTSFEFEIIDRIPHITIAINPIDGAPKDSNYITNWEKIETIKLTGVVEEIL